MSPPAETKPRLADLEAARARDEAAFERLLGPHRTELLAHCYRMLGSAADAEDALQESLLRAWRALPDFEGRSSLRSWLYRIATNVCLNEIERRPRRVLPLDYSPPSDPHDPPGGQVTESIWLEAFPDAGLEGGAASPEARYEQRESVELAFIAALQHLPGRQRAVLLLRDVLGFAPHEIAEARNATSAAIYSTLQRAHHAVEERLPELSQQATLRTIGDQRLSQLVERYVDAWEQSDIEAIMEMLTEDATLAMPPRPTWYRGRLAIRAFLAAGPASQPRRWRRIALQANGQLAFAVYDSSAQTPDSSPHIEVLTLQPAGKIAAITAFHDPEAFARFGLARELTG